ncbi:unnamed protein product [Paramecium sonneborni]|uniref:Uncharacterized protein n=1 Tax=Paramecium sonneborni TaxID=65129 RepID=A0A8S1QMR0_9CILI|nr:unnamed protein product [Paramecium sonneborni]
MQETQFIQGWIDTIRKGNIIISFDFLLGKSTKPKHIFMKKTIQFGMRNSK